MLDINQLGIIVGGRRTLEPGAYAEIDVSAFNVISGALVKRGVILGTSKGGPVGEMVTFRTGNEAVEVLKGGEGLKLSLLAFDPSAQVAGAGEINFVRVNQAVSASLDLGDVIVTAKATHAGTISNGFKVKRELYPDNLAYLLFISDTSSGTLEESPPLGPALSVSYLGVGLTPTATIVTHPTIVDALQLELRGDSAAENHDIPLGTDGIENFSQLSQFVNSTNAWSSEVLYQHSAYDTSKLPLGAVTLAAPVRNIIAASDVVSEPIEVTTASPHNFTDGDTVTVAGVVGNTPANTTTTIVVTGPNTFTLDGTTGTGTTPYVSGGTATNDTAPIEGILDLGIEAQLQWLGGSLLVDGADGGVAADVTGLGYIFLIGGSEGGVPTFADYFSALQAIEEEDIQAVLLTTTDSAAQAAALQHCIDMSHPVHRRERFLFCGTALQSNNVQEKQQSIALASTLQSNRAVVVGTSVLRQDIFTGQVESLSPNQVAAMIFGMAVGTNFNVPLTNKTIKSSGITYKHTVGDYEDFLVNGVFAIFKNVINNTPRIYRDVTSYTADNNKFYQSRFYMAIGDYLKRKLRIYTRPFVGEVATRPAVDSAFIAVETALKEEDSSDPKYPNGVLTPGEINGEPSPAFKIYDVSYSTTEATLYIRFEAHNVGVIDFVHSLGKLTPVDIRVQG